MANEDVEPYGRVACRFTTTLEETAVFVETPTREEALEQLNVGAFEVGFLMMGIIYWWKQQKRWKHTIQFIAQTISQWRQYLS